MQQMTRLPLHCGEDGVPYTINISAYDNVISDMEQIVYSINIGSNERGGCSLGLAKHSSSIRSAKSGGYFALGELAR